MVSVSRLSISQVPNAISPVVSLVSVEAGRFARARNIVDASSNDGDAAALARAGRVMGVTGSFLLAHHVPSFKHDDVFTQDGRQVAWSQIAPSGPCSDFRKIDRLKRSFGEAFGMGVPPGAAERSAPVTAASGF